MQLEVLSVYLLPSLLLKTVCGQLTGKIWCTFFNLLYLRILSRKTFVTRRLHCDTSRSSKYYAYGSDPSIALAVNAMYDNISKHVGWGI